jgi:hypothetical protein
VTFHVSAPTAPKKKLVPNWYHGSSVARGEKRRKSRLSRVFLGVSDGTRTRDRLDHNQELYLLSYAHHAAALSGDVRNLAVGS